jgi:hypothetical protein
MIPHIISQDCFYTNTYQGDSEIIQKHINHILEFDKGRVKTNRGGYQSNDITFGFNDLIQFALKSFSLIKEPVRLDNFWININKGQDSNISHIHSITGWSAVYYHKTCCDKSTLQFQHLVPTLVDVKCEYIPKEKTMVFFNSSIPHLVNCCGNLEHERVSIAFNFIRC